MNAPLVEAEEALQASKIQTINCAWSGWERGFQVSVLRSGSSGWQVYYGHDLEETIARAVADGDQTFQGVKKC